MFSNYQLKKKTRYSHFQDYKKPGKKTKQKTKIDLPKPQLKPTLLNNN